MTSGKRLPLTATTTTGRFEMDQVNATQRVATQVIVRCSCGTKMIATPSEEIGSKTDVSVAVYGKLVALKFVEFDKVQGMDVWTSTKPHAFFVS